MTPDLFDTAALTPEPTTEAPEPAPPEKDSEPAAQLPPLQAYETAEKALAAIIAAYERKPLYFRGYRVLTMEIADAIEAAKIMTHE